MAAIGSWTVNITVQPVYKAFVGATEADRALQETIQHQLKIKRRATDGLEHIRRRSLLLQ
jgi:hypothetical protein